MTSARWPLPRSILFEAILLVLILAGGVHALWTLRTAGYLPQPFVYDPGDTFMDWFNTAYWAHRPGIYSVWRAVYPPLSFVLLQMVTTPACYVSSPFAGRDCDLLGTGAVVASYIITMAVSYRALRLVQPQAATVRGSALAFGLPGLYLLERGNILILCLLFLAIAIVPAMGGRWAKALSSAVMINLKPYMLLPALSFAVRREWRMLELCGFATIAMFCVTWAMVGSGSPLELFQNTINFAQVTGSDIVFESFYTTSFNNMFNVIDGGFPILRFVGSRDYDHSRFAIEIFMHAAQISAMGAVALAFLRSQTLTHARLALLLLLLSLTSRSPGGYTELLVVFLVFLESWRGLGSVVAIITAYLISIPYEWIVSYLPDIHTSAWLSGHAVTARFGIGIGQFARPIGLLVILLALSLDSIVQITRGLIADRKTPPVPFHLSPA